MSVFHKDRELDHMFELQEKNRDSGPDRTSELWDKRMKNWKQNFWTANLKDNGSGKSCKIRSFPHEKSKYHNSYWQQCHPDTVFPLCRYRL